MDESRRGFFAKVAGGLFAAPVAKLILPSARETEAIERGDIDAALAAVDLTEVLCESIQTESDVDGSTHVTVAFVAPHEVAQKVIDAFWRRPAVLGGKNLMQTQSIDVYCWKMEDGARVQTSGFAWSTATVER